MRYRIKIKIFKDGHKEYLPEVKGVIYGWNCISWVFNYHNDFPKWFLSREEALESIDKNYTFKQKTDCKSIEFEYINKP